MKKRGEKSDFTIFPYFCKNLPVVMYRKFRNVPILKDFPPICPCFLGFGVGRYASVVIHKALPKLPAVQIELETSHLFPHPEVFQQHKL